MKTLQELAKAYDKANDDLATAQASLAVSQQNVSAGQALVEQCTKARTVAAVALLNAVKEVQ